MAAYLVRRLLYTIPIVFGVVLILFLVFNVVGGNPARAMLGRNFTMKALRDLEYQLGLDLPLIVNLDGLTVRGRQAACLEQLDALVATGPAPVSAAAKPEHGRALLALSESYRFAVPALLGVLMDPGQAADRRVWADFALEHVTGERIGFRAADGRDADAALDRWGGWWERRRDRVAFSPSLRNIVQSQFLHFCWQAATFQLGKSLQRRQFIWDMVLEGAPASLAVTLPGFVLGEGFSILIALLCAFRRGGYLDRSLVVATVLGMSITMLAYIIGGQYVLAYKLGLFPVTGFRSPYLPFVALPVLLFVIVTLGPNVRFFRTVMLDEVNQDYVRTARSKGLSNRSVMLRHVLKNAMIPIITYSVIAIPFLFMGSLLLERFFGIPGLGSTMVDAIFSADWPVVRAFTYIGAILYVIGNLVTDICYALVDPRISLK